MANNPPPSGAQPNWPPAGGNLGPQSFNPSVPGQFRPGAPTQPGQPYVIAASQQFRPPNVGMPGVQSQHLQYSQQMQQFQPRPGQPGGAVPQPMAPTYAQHSRPLTSAAPQSQHAAPPLNSQMTGVGAPGMPSYSFVPSSYGQPQNNVGAPTQFQPGSEVHAHAGQPWMSYPNQTAPLSTPTAQTGQQPPSSNPTDPAASASNLTQQTSDWQEHMSAEGKRYYYNKKTRQSSWEKPVELMTPIERADASTVWKEFTTAEGRKYYYNKITRESKWSIPEELKSAREQAEMAASHGNIETGTTSVPPASAAISSTETPTTDIPASSNASMASSPFSVTPVANPSPTPAQYAAQNASGVQPSAFGVSPSAFGVSPSPAAVLGSPSVSAISANAGPTTSGSENITSQDAANADGAAVHVTEETKKGPGASGKTEGTPVEEKAQEDEPLVYASKQEAKNAFKALLESANVQSDWTWEQTMREIVNDKRYAALKTLGERKQAFNEFLGQRKKVEAEERRARQKKAREEFTKMLEECEELTSSMRWSKAQSLFEDDERFKAVDRPRDREDLYESYTVELERKEKEKAAEERKQYVAEYREYLESCDFIKVNSPWRKIQDRLEDDERCSRLEKIDRLLVFQDYIHDLEKEEEEKKKIQKEQLRRAERKNRDAFRQLMEEHVGDGTLTAKTYWRDYCLKVRELPQYLAVASNTSGSTPKDLFEDVTEELENQYHEDKTRVKESMKLGKISMVSTWTYEDFKGAISEDISSPPSEVNLKLIYEDLLERAREKEEKEAKKRQRIAEDFTKLLSTLKEITTSSDWEECKPLVEESQEYRSIGEESIAKEIFEEHITYLKDKAKEKERKREEEKAKREEKEKRKDKERKDKERDREREKERSKKDDSDSDNLDDSYDHKEKKKEKDKKHRKRHQSAADDGSSERDDKDEPKKSRRHSSDRKKSRKHAYSPESDSESKYKKHKRDNRDSSRKTSANEELEDGELGDAGDI